MGGRGRSQEEGGVKKREGSIRGRSQEEGKGRERTNKGERLGRRGKKKSCQMGGGMRNHYTLSPPQTI